MKLFICLTVLIKFIAAVNLPPDSYLQLDVSSNPVLPGLTKTLTMSCRIRVQSHGAAPNLADTSDALKQPGASILAAIEGREIESDKSLGAAVNDAPNQNDGSPAETGDASLNPGSATRLPEKSNSTESTPYPASTTIQSNTTSTATTSTTLATEAMTIIWPSTTSKPQSNVTSSPADVFHLMSIVITKKTSPGEDVTVAEVTPYDPAVAEGTYVDVLQVNGSVFHTQLNGELGYLTLTWRTPKDDQVGTYTCEASALTHLGHIAILTGSLEILARQPGINDLVPLIVDLEERISQLEQENKELKHRLDLLKA